MLCRLKCPLASVFASELGQGKAECLSNTRDTLTRLINETTATNPAGLNVLSFAGFLKGKRKWNLF
jgi:hypothetical protein